MNVLSATMRMVRGALSRGRNLWFRMQGMRIEGYAWLQRIHVAGDCSGVLLGEGVALDHGVNLVVGEGAEGVVLTVEKGSYINRYTTLEAHRSLSIEEGCMIGPYCYICDAEHGIAPERAVRDQPLEYRPTRIGREAWIGAHVTIRAGVTIGEGAVVGAGSVVTRDVPPGAIAVGVPARVERTRAS